ncbi:hypothetical protein [Uliginosibacterium sp. H1]|uniref:hypothetical protein n=1 Tax=Uliginosibacterium sp. H1 TaxID=3114757 RepID=UPI002E19C32B|nr:hypothetical protein [Uliginosibacterium sp. H1]
MHAHRSAASFVASLLCAALLASPLAVDAQPANVPPRCDPLLPSSAGDPLGYRKRGDRCEGRYIREVSSSTLAVVSFVESTVTVDRAAKAPLNLSWRAPAAADNVRLRAQSLTRRVYYRMDAERPARAGAYAWPTSLLASLDPPAAEFGLLATTPMKLGDVQRDVHLPLRAAHEGAPAVTATPRLVVVPGGELDELFVSLTEVDATGRPGRTLRRSEPLGLGYYPAQRPVTVPLAAAEVAAGGVLRVELVARLRSGASSSAEAWLYLQGP